MRRSLLISLAAIAFFTSALVATQSPSAGPYKVLKTAKVGGEGGWDYIYAEAEGRRLYIPRNAVAARAATDTAPAVAAVEKRLTIFNLDTLEKVGEISGVGGNGAAVCPKTGHGVTSDHPQPALFDVATMKLIKNIEVPQGPPAFSADGIYCDTFNDRIYIFSHPDKSALVVDPKDGAVLGHIDLGGTPEQGVADGKGMLYVMMQDRPGSVAVVDVKTMKTTTHYPLGENGGCNGLALDAKNGILFAACSAVGPAPERGQPAPPVDPNAPPPQTFVILSAKDGKVLARLPLAGSSDGAVFNPATMEAFSAQGNGTMTIVKETGPTTFELEQNLQTMNGARTITFDSKTGHLLTMAQEYGPAPAPAPGAAPGRAGRGPVVPGSFTILVVGK
jgi:hypothetical protein